MRKPYAVFVLAAIALAATSASTPEASADETRERIIRGIKISQTTQAASEVWERFTSQDEYYLGRAVAAHLVTQYGVLDDDKATRYINLVGHSLAFGAQHPYVYDRYRFVILDTEDPNAFAVPGAYVFISRGMLQYTKDEDTLAAILAHEIAHIQYDHGIRSIKKKRWNRLIKLVAAHGFGELAGKTLGKFVAAFGSFSGDYLETLFVKGYKKNNNALADRSATQYLTDTGYDPNAMLDVLKVMALEHEANKGTFAKTHPSPSKRIKKITNLNLATRTRPDVRQKRFCAALGHLVGNDICQGDST